MTIPAVLEHYGITEGPEAQFRFQTAEGAYRNEQLKPIAEDMGNWSDFLDDSTAVPLRGRHPGRPYWYQLMDDRDAVYVQFREAAHDPDDPPAQFVRRLLTQAGNREIDRLVLDLRDNHGGRGMWNQPFLRGLPGHPRFDRPGGLYVLIGPETFSAAMLLLTEIEQHSQAILVGQPTGAPPDHFGDARLVTLENSGLTVRLSTIFWKNWPAGEFRDAIHPHLPVPDRFQDLAAGRDPALEHALLHSFPSDPLDFFGHLLTDIGVNAAALYLGKLAPDPGIEADFAGGLVTMGHEFLSAGDLANARYVFLVADNHYPGRAAIVAGLGRVFEESEEPEQAADRYRRALELDPDLEAAREGIRRLGPGNG